MKKILAFIMSVMIGATAILAISPATNTYAANCDGEIMGLRPWYQGLADEKNGACVVVKPKDGTDEAGWSKFVWRIILNISADLSLLVSYAAIIFVIYGGFKYIMSTGEPSKVAQAKTIIMNALIGFVIALLATIIVSTIIGVLGGSVK